MRPSFETLRRRLGPILGLLLACLAATPAGARRAPQLQPPQPLPPMPAAPAPGAPAGAEITVYLMTMGPGEAVWEKFGHNALWIRNSATGEDVAYNWGLFDFGEDDFIPRFLQGSMRYWMAGAPAQATVDGYAFMDRSVWVQELDLRPAERRELYDFVKWNERPENRFYFYDYYLDNCSTRVRDALDRVLGGQIEEATAGVPTPTTFRWHTRRLTEEVLPIYTGIDFMLGPAVDRPISVWEEMFLPMRLRDHVRGLSVRSADGTVRPLVKSELQLYAASRDLEPAAPADFLPAFAALGAALAALVSALAWRAAQGSRAARTGFAVVGTLWSLFAGIAGTLMLLTWLFTDHTDAYRNENLLQYAPLSLLLVVLLPRFLRRGRAPELTWHVAAFVASLSVLGLVLQLVPGLDQVNGLAIALALPVHAAVAVGVWLVRGAVTVPVREDVGVEAA